MSFKSILLIVIIAFGCQSPQIRTVEKRAKDKTKIQSNSNFDPYGYYLAKEVLSLDDYSFERLFIPGKTDTPSVRLVSKKTNVFLDIQTDKFSINEKQGSFEFSDSKVGKVSIKGQFLGKRGPSLDEVKTDQVVFQGTITIKGMQTPISMTWFEGD